MRRMSLIRVFLLVFTVILTAEPVVHNHPLLTGSEASGASVCAVCVSGVGPLPVAAPAVAAPEIVLTTIATPALVEPTIVAAAPRASRAPPTA
jgi:hypothetical protein